MTGPVNHPSVARTPQEVTYTAPAMLILTGETRCPEPAKWPTGPATVTVSLIPAGSSYGSTVDALLSPYRGKLAQNHYRWVFDPLNGT